MSTATAQYSDEHDDALIAQPFPNSFFHYGDELGVTKAQNSALQKQLPDLRAISRKTSNWAPITQPAKQRSLHHPNILGFDETVLQTITEPRKFWCALLAIFPPRPWCDTAKLIAHLATSRPLDKPSNSRLWKTAREWIDDAQKIGSAANWTPNIVTVLRRLEDEHWEALRIIGDSDAGFGTFPQLIKTKLIAAGMCWIAVDPERRRVPLCWARWATDNGFKFAETIPIHKRSPILENKATDAAANLKQRQPSKTARAHEPQGDKNKHTAFLDKNETAAQALKLLRQGRATAGSKPSTMTTSTATALRNAVHDALYDGPIEGRTREIVHQAFQAAGLHNQHHLERTIRQVLSQATSEQDETIKALEAKILRMEQQQAHFVAAMIGLSNRMQAIETSEIQEQGETTTDKTNEASKKRKNFWGPT
ncbi:hypothetical protein GGS21DRAFT_490191 [Xylaria nigripes]|nr:hypothetical protein GGS21DRAFT_490191 [Xylaria nigripes]